MEYLDEELADNVDDVDIVDDVDNTQPASPADNGAKAYAERLNKDRERIRTEERENLAKSFGYDSWKEYIDSQTDSKLLDKGLDPEEVRPLLKDLIHSDPDYIEAMEYRKKQEALQMQTWSEGEVKKLNEKFGTNFKDINELDEETIKYFNSGMSLVNAYASQHFDEIESRAVKRAKVETGKEHLKQTDGSDSGDAKPKQTLTEEQFAKFRSLNPDATDEQIKAYIERTK